MNIYLVRHSRAVDEGLGLADEDRYLSSQGRDLAVRVGQRLAEVGIALDRVLTSPLVRAVQTAELFVQGLGANLEVVTLPLLAPGYPPQLAVERLSGYGTSLALVGHEPTISALGAVLVQRPAFPPFRPMQVAAIENGEPRWTLRPDTLELDRLLVA